MKPSNFNGNALQVLFYPFVSPTAKMFSWLQTIVNYSCFSINKA